MSDMSIVLLPGLGADERLFGPQAAALERVVVPAWIPPRRQETLSEYARRLGETLDVPRQFILGGSSLGGMVASEMTRHIRPEALVLLGSCRDARSLARWTLPCRPLAPWLPARGFRWAGCLAPAVVRLARGMDAPTQRLVVEMFRQADPQFMRWALAAILRWKSSPAGDTPTFQIHGGRDLMIPLCRVRPDRIIPDAGHLLTLTHPDAVNDFLRQVVAKSLS
ncbi:MAG: alpha/beta hydrolase [Pirellulales bacterium]|nr:alpha/beta hydrolase [Pirellulales bacterium]